MDTDGVTVNDVPLDKWLGNNIREGMGTPIDPEVQDDINSRTSMPLGKRKATGKRKARAGKPGKVRQLTLAQIKEEYTMATQPFTKKTPGDRVVDKVLTFIINETKKMEGKPVYTMTIISGLPEIPVNNVSPTLSSIWRRLGSDHPHSARILRRSKPKHRSAGYGYTLDPLLTTTAEQAVEICYSTDKVQKEEAKTLKTEAATAPGTDPPAGGGAGSGAGAPELPKLKPKPKPPAKSESDDAILVNVRWFDGYLEAFMCQEVRQGGSILWMRLTNGENRTVPLREVRWFSTDPESHAYRR